MSAACATFLSVGTALAQGPRLELHMVASTPIPEEFSVAGVDAASERGFAVWSLHRPEILVCCSAGLRVVRNPEFARPVAARIAGGDSLLEVLDGDQRSLLTVTFGGTIIQRHTVPLRWDIGRGVRGAEGWYVVGRDSTGATLVAWVSSLGEVLREDELLPPPDSSTPIPTVQLVQSPEGATAALAGPPYTTWTIAPGMRPRLLVLQLPQLDSGAATSNTAPIWVSLPPLQVDSTLIRVFSDLRSDRRVLVLYDPRGAILRETTLDAALGLIASQPERHLLVGVRKITGTELAFYRWRWRTDHTP
jgi:hypothetical protein